VTRARLWGGGGGIRIVLEPSFSTADVALIELRDPLPDTEAITKVRLIGVLQDDLVAPGTMATVSGWGLGLVSGRLGRPAHGLRHRWPFSHRHRLVGARVRPTGVPRRLPIRP